MPEIGATLREARMRQHIDISEIESQTKIRAKYLRALENEEWDLLPGPTFVKSFLRTYAEALGLDARLILEEYKLRHERLAEHELLPIAPPSRREGRRRGPPPGIGRDVMVAVLVVALVGLLIVLGHDGGSKSDNTPKTSPSATATTTPAKSRHRRKHHGQATAAVASLKLEPKGPVWVCLQAAGNRTLVPGRPISPGDSLPTWHSRRFVVTLGNGNLVMRINGKAQAVPDVSAGIGYVIDHAGKRHVLPASQRPSC
jgi:cytoskeleton protein RodZ